MAVKALTKKALTALYEPFDATIQAATVALVAAEESLTLVRVALGRAAGDAVSALTTAGASAEEAQARVMSSIHVVYAVVEWTTVQGWIRAATVADSLPAAIRESFSTEALVTLGRVKPEERNEFAEKQNAAGITGVRALRDAVAAHNAATGKESKSKARQNLTQAEDAVKRVEEYLGKNELPAEGTEGYDVALVMLGVYIGQKCPKHRAASLKNGIEEALYTGPVADEDDGSDS